MEKIFWHCRVQTRSLIFSVRDTQMSCSVARLLCRSEHGTGFYLRQVDGFIWSTSEVVHLQVSAWGGYVFIINLIPLHVFTLLVMGRYSNRLFTSYTTFYILGLLLSMQIPFVGFQPIRTSEHMAASGNVFSFC